MISTVEAEVLGATYETAGTATSHVFSFNDNGSYPVYARCAG